MSYRLKNGWRAKDKNGKLKKTGEIIELNKPDTTRLLALGAIEKVSVVVDKEENEQNDGEQ